MLIGASPERALAAWIAGAAPPQERKCRNVLARAVLSRRDAELVVPVVLEQRAGDDPLALPQSRRGGALAALAHADASLSVPAGGPSLQAGESVVVALRR